MILVGSKNPHKLAEVRAILEPLGLRAVIAVNLPGVEETGASFAENAAQKALAFAQFLRAPCLADDSGLVVPALGGEPGVHSARYAGKQGDDAANIRLLLERIAKRGIDEPEAYFQCSLAIALPGAPGRILTTCEGRARGRILAVPRGENGFGYDPVFLDPGSGKTFAELDPAEKNARSHRGAALRELARELAEGALRAELEL